MATSSIQAFGGSAMNGGVNINDVRKLVFVHNNEHVPFAVYDPINDDDDTTVAVQQVPEHRLVPPSNSQYVGNVLMTLGEQPAALRLWMPIVMCSEGNGGQGVNQFDAAIYNAVGAFGTHRNCQLATEYDLDHGIVRFQPKIARVDKDPYTGDIFPRVVDQYTHSSAPRTLLSKILVGKPYPLCDFTVMKKDASDLQRSPNEGQDYDQPTMMWRRVYIDSDMQIKGFVVFDRFGDNNNQHGGLFELNGDTPVAIATGTFTATVLGKLDCNWISPNNVINPNHTPSIYAHEFIYDNGNINLTGGMNYLFPTISKPDNHNTTGGPECVYYQHAWPATPSTEKWTASGTAPIREFSPSTAVFKAQVIQLILSDNTRIFI